MTCPHCQAANPEGAEFCSTCGKALPVASAGPQLVTGTQTLADTAAGQQLQSEELEAKAKTARRTLMAVAVLMTLGIALVFAQHDNVKTQINLELNSAGVTPDNPLVKDKVDEVERVFTILKIVQMMLALTYYGLYFWSRSNPLPAAITGLVIYVTLVLVLAAIEPMTLAQGWLVKLLVIIGLAKAIEAGLKHRELLRKMNLYPAA